MVVLHFFDQLIDQNVHLGLRSASSVRSQKRLLRVDSLKTTFL